jgi:hypothetical protein
MQIFHQSLLAHAVYPVTGKITTGKQFNHPYDAFKNIISYVEPKTSVHVQNIIKYIL